MAERVRKNQKIIYFSDDELERIYSIMNELKISNFSTYARKSMLNSTVINVDMQPIKELISELNRVGNNINQVARICNETHSVYGDEIAKMQNSYDEVMYEIAKVLSHGH